MASDPLRDQLLAQMGMSLPGDVGVGSLVDQISALQGLQPSHQQEPGLDIFQPVRTAFGATGGLAGAAAGMLLPGAYEKAGQERRAAAGVTPESPWYEKVEALPTAGDVAANLYSPEFRQSGLGHFVEPLTRIGGAIATDPTTYLGGAAGKVAGSVAGRIAPELVAAAAQAGTDAERANIAGQIAARVLNEGTPLQQGLYSGASAFLNAEPIALAAPAALAYGPETVKSAYEQGKAALTGESEHPWADAASAALLAGMAGMMAHGLLQAGKASMMWKQHAMDAGLAPDVIDAGMREIAGNVQQAAQPTLPPALQAEPFVDATLAPPEVTRTPAPEALPAEPIPGAPVRVAEGQPLQGEIVARQMEPPPAPEQPPLPVNEILPADFVESQAAPAPKRVYQRDVNLVAEPLPEEPAPVAENRPQPVEAQPENRPQPIEEPLPAAPRDLPNEAAVLDDRIKKSNLQGWEQKKVASALQKGTSEAEKIDAANSALDYVEAQRAKRAPAPVQPPLEEALRSSLKLNAPEAPQSPAAAPGAPETRPEPVAAPAEPLAKLEPTPEHAADWERYIYALDNAKPKGAADKALIEGAKAEAAKATPEQQAEVLRNVKENYGGRPDTYVNGSVLGREVKRGEQVFETTAAKAEKPVEMGVEKPKPLAKGQEFNAARDILKQHKLTLRAFMEDPESGDLTYVENKGRGRSTTHNLKDSSSKAGKIWGQYVDLIDSGKSDAEARKIVVETQKASESVVNNLVRAGRASTRTMVAKRFAEEPVSTKREAAPVDKEAISAQRQVADTAVGDLTKKLEAVGGATPDVLKNAEFKTTTESTLDELAKHLVGARALGPRDPLRSIASIRTLAERMGISPDSIRRNVTGEELVQQIADKAGIQKDYVGVVRGQLKPKVRPTAAWTPTMLSKGDVTGGAEGFAFRADTIDPATLAQDITNNPQMQTLVLGEGVKARDLKALEAALPEGVSLKPRETGADTLLQAYDVERPKTTGLEAMVARGAEKPIVVHGEVVYPSQWTLGLDPEAVGAMQAGFKDIVPSLNNYFKSIGAKFDETAAGQPREPIGNGVYHMLYRVPAEGPNGEQYVLRAGRSPYLPLPTDEQRALVQPALKSGVMARDADGTPLFYSLHQQGYVPSKAAAKSASVFDKSGKLAKMVDPLNMFKQPFDEAVHNKIQNELASRQGLPDGMSLQEHIDAAGELMEKLEHAGLDDSDITMNNKYFRHDQVVWTEVPEGARVPKNSVTRIAIGMDGEPRQYKLQVADYGSVYPKNPPAGSAWEKVAGDVFARIAMSKARETDNAAEVTMSAAELAQRIKAYDEDLKNAQKLGLSKLVLANHDRVMSADYLARLGQVGEEVARGLEEIHDRLAFAIQKDGGMPDAMETRFSGLTASPHLSAMFQRMETATKRFGRIFINPVENIAAAAGRTKENAIDEMLYSLFHEVAHSKASGHGLEFHDTYQYIKNLATAEGMMDDFRAALHGAWGDEHFNAMRDELVPQFLDARRKYGTEAVGELSARNPESGAQAIEGQPHGTEEGVAGNQPAGVQPGGNVPGGGEGPSSGVRTGTTAGGTGAERNAPRGTTRSATRGESTATLLGRIEARASREGSLTRGDAQVLMDKLVEESRVKLTPVKDVYRKGYEYAKLVEGHLTDEEREALGKSLPSPTKKDQFEGVVNLLHYTDMDPRMKARIALMYDFTKGAWARDKKRGWDEVGNEVQSLLNIKSPAEWTRIYKSRGGGLLDRDVELLRQVHNELAGDLMGAEDRLYDALNAGVDNDTLTKLRDQVDYKEQLFHHSMANLTKGLTGSARALAIARHEVRNLDPVLRMKEDLAAGLRTRLQSKFKDPSEVEKHTQDLLAKFYEVKNKGGSWEEFYNAYRAILGSKLWPDKVLELYKAGLLGYPSRVANIAGNTLFRAVRYTEDAVAGALDAGRVAAFGGERQRHIGEASASMLALQRSMREAFPKWFQAQGDAFALKPQEFEQAFGKGGLMEDFLQHPGAIGGKTGEFVRFMFKGLSSDDALAKHLSRVDSMYRQIYRRVRSGEYKLNTNETHSQATERIYQSLNDNYENALNGASFDAHNLKHWQQMATVAEEAALKDTFQSDLGNFGRGMNWLLRNVPALQLIFPFVRTPTNIAKETIKRTPLGLINLASKWKDLSEGERVTEFSKAAVGSLVGAGVLAQAMGGHFTGGGPVDPDELEALKSTGWQPYSVRVGDNWVSYQRMEPMAAIMGIAADAAEGLRNGDFQKWQNGVVKVFQSAAENITNKTFLSGLDGMFSAVSHPKEYLARFVKQMQGSIVPNSLGFIPVNGIARAMDPVYRHTDPFSMNVFYNKIPYLSSTLEPQYGPTGELRQRPGTAFERALSPFARTVSKTGPVAQGTDEVVRLSAAPRAPGQYWTAKGGVRVDFLPEERQELAKAYQDATAVIGQRVINDPNYLKLPDNEMDPNYRYGMKTKQEVLEKLYARYRDNVMDRLKGRLTARAINQVNTRERT